MASTSDRFRARLELSNWFLQILAPAAAVVRPPDPTPKAGRAQQSAEIAEFIESEAERLGLNVMEYLDTIVWNEELVSGD